MASHQSVLRGHLCNRTSAPKSDTPCGMGGGRQLPPELQGMPSEYLVEFENASDPKNPQNWSMRRKVRTAFFVGWSTLASTFASADVSPAVSSIAQRFHISVEVATLATDSLFLGGYTVGPLVWAPLSEIKGRKLPLVTSMFGFCIFAAAAATAKDTQTLMICRFFQGAMGSSPISLTSATFLDMFHPFHRGYAMIVFATTVFAGPMIAPLISGFTIDNNGLGWTWTVWWSFFFGLFGLLGLVFVAEETYVPIILARKADALRRRTGNWAIHARHDELDVKLEDFARKYFTLPLKMLATEPILLLVSIYTSFIYALLYAFLQSYPLVFHQGYGMSLGVSGLPFFGMIVGLLIAATVNMSAQPHYKKLIIKNNMVLVPEWRMPLATTGAISFAAGLFWFGWTGAYPERIHWIVPTISGLATGYGLLMIFMCCFTYLTDVYKANAASAFAANTIMRSALAAGFPMFATQLFTKLGINWANTLLACMALILVPVPVCFYFFGGRVRAKSRFVPGMSNPVPRPVSEEKV